MNLLRQELTYALADRDFTLSFYDNAPKKGPE